MDPETAKSIQKLAGESGKTFQSVAPEEDPSAKAKNINQTLGQMNILSQAPYFNPDRVLDYGRRDAGSEVELYDPETRMAVARIAREPKEDKKPIFWQSNSYDPNLDYDSVNKGTHISLIDPTTQKEVARMVNIAGGSDEPDETPNPTPNSENNEDDPYANMSFVQLVQEIGKKRQLLSEFEARLNRLPVLRTAANNARLADMRGEVMNLDTEMQLLMTENEEDKLAFEQFDALVEQEVDYRLREGKDFSTAMHQEKLAYDDLQAFLSAETEDMPNILSNPRLAGALKARYAYLMAEYKSQFPDQLSTESGATAPAPEPIPPTTNPAENPPTPAPSPTTPPDPEPTPPTPIIDDAERRHQEQLAQLARQHQEQLDAAQAAAQEARSLQQKILDAAEKTRKDTEKKNFPHDEFLLSTVPGEARRYIETKLFEYETFQNGVNAETIKAIRSRIETLGKEKQLIGLIDARRILHDAAATVPIEGAMDVKSWEENMKGFFVGNGGYLQLLLGDYCVNKETGDIVTDKQEIATDQALPEAQRKLEKHKYVPGLSEALKLLQTETHKEIIEIDTPQDGKKKIEFTCNFFQGESSGAGVEAVKGKFQKKLEERPDNKLTPEQAETAIHLAERLLRVTLVGARMNGPLRKIDDYKTPEFKNLAARRIDLSLTNDKEYGKNAVRLVDGKAVDSEWDKIYRGTHPDILLDTEGKAAGPTKGRGTAFREALYFPAFLMQRNVGGYPELRRLANLRASDLLSHFTDVARSIRAITGENEIVDFDKLLEVYSDGSFPNKQNVLNLWVENVRTAMDNRSLFYADPKESGKGITGLIADPIPHATRQKILEQDIDYQKNRDNMSTTEGESKEELEKLQKLIIEFANEFVSKYVVIYSGVPKDKVKALIWLEQEFLKFLTSKEMGKKYFHHRSNKKKGIDLYFHLGPIMKSAFEYGFYKNEIIQNIDQLADEDIYRLHRTMVETNEPSKVPAGTNLFTNAGHPVNIGIRALGGGLTKKS